MAASLEVISGWLICECLRRAPCLASSDFEQVASGEGFARIWFAYWQRDGVDGGDQGL